MTSKIENVECLCAWVSYLGPARQVVESLITVSITALTALKAFLLLIPQDPYDQLRLKVYQAELAALEQATVPIVIPFNLVNGYIRPFADCAPVATFASQVNQIRRLLLSDVEARKFQIQQYVDALNLNGQQIIEIDLAIQLMTELKSAMEDCG